MSEIFLAFYFIVLLVPSIFGLHRYYLVYLYYRTRDRKPLPPSFESLCEIPRVTVQLPIYNERYVASRLIRAVCDFDYPIGKLEIQVLDDSTDDTSLVVAEEVRFYRARGFQIDHVRRKDREGFKAGALNEGLKSASGEFVAVFDADFIPLPDFLKRTIPHFYERTLLSEDPASLDVARDPELVEGLPVRAGREGARGMPGGIPRSIGMVQARWGHLNRDFSWLTQAQAVLLDGHFVIEHSARSRSGCFFNFNGTAGIWRRECIESAGGWSGETLTEDIDLSYRAQMAGWRFIYLEDLVAPAELPVDINALKTQQHRWAKGSVQVARKLLLSILKGPHPFRVKMEAFFHLAANFNYLLLALLSFLMPLSLYLRHQKGWYGFLWIDLPIFLSATWSVSIFYYHSQKTIYPDWFSRVKYIPFSLSLGIGLCINNAKAVLEGLFSKEGGVFDRTPKYAVTRKGDPWKDKRYRGKLNYVSLVELVLTIHFSVAALYALKEELYFSLPFVSLFLFGFLYTTSLSLLQGRYAERFVPGPQIASLSPPQIS